MKKVLFVCVENANRSQMAEAFAKIHGEGKLEAWSAGSRASGTVNPRAIRAMKELGYDLSVHKSLKLDEVPQTEYDYTITMGCGDVCPFIPAKERLDWALPDPKQMEPEDFNQVRDEIERRVLALLSEISETSISG